MAVRANFLQQPFGDQRLDLIAVCEILQWANAQQGENSGLDVARNAALVVVLTVVCTRHGDVYDRHLGLTCTWHAALYKPVGESTAGYELGGGI